MELNIGEILVSILSLAFLCWAGVVGFIGHGIRGDLRDIRREVRSFGGELKVEGEKFNRYVIQTERRLSVVEDRLEIDGLKEK